MERIVIIVNKGCAEVDTLPPNVEVEIQDWDSGEIDIYTNEDGQITVERKG